MFLRILRTSRIALTMLAFLLVQHFASDASGGGLTKSSQRRSPVSRKQNKQPRIDYSKFSHNTHVAEQKLACDSCHKFPTKSWNEVRKADAAFPDVTEFPEHSSCLDCHRQQFFARERPAPAICSNCHVKATPRDTARFLFPSLGDISGALSQKKDIVTEFAVSFPHDKHIDVVGLNAPLQPLSGFVTVSWQEKPTATDSAEPKSCPVCHQTFQPQGNSDEEYVTKPPKNIGDAFWLKKGTFKTLPNSHTVCFTCHNTDAGIAPAPSECGACHKLAMPRAILKVDFDPKLAETIGVTDKSILTTWSRRISAGAFRHEGGEHPNVSCINCHNVATMNTTMNTVMHTVEMKTPAVPVRSCGGAEGCHVTATTDDGGALNYEVDQKKKDVAFVCTKCHISFGKEAAPEDHLKSIPTPKSNLKQIDE